MDGGRMDVEGSGDFADGPAFPDQGEGEDGIWGVRNPGVTSHMIVGDEVTQ